MDVNLIRNDEKIIEVLFKDRYNEPFNEYNPYYYVVPDNFPVPEYRIIVVAPNIVIKTDDGQDDNFKLQFAKVTRIIRRTRELGNGLFEPNEEWKMYAEKAKRPSYYANINLDNYFSNIEKEKRKKELEKQLDEATKKIEKIVKYKELANLNPEYKELYEEYLKTIQIDKTQQPLLESTAQQVTDNGEVTNP